VPAGIFFSYLQLKPQWEEAQTQVREKTRELSVRNNLVQIGSAAETYFSEKPGSDRVTVPELNQWLPGALFLTVVDGESYDSIVVTKGWRSISVQLPSGQVVEWTKR
jgi:hypothetical protein